MKTKPRTRETGGSNRSYMLTTLRFVAGASSNPHVVTINIAHVSAMVPHGRLFEGGRRHKRTRRFENHSECACTHSPVQTHDDAFILSLGPVATGMSSRLRVVPGVKPPVYPHAPSIALVSPRPPVPPPRASPVWPVVRSPSPPPPLPLAPVSNPPCPLRPPLSSH